MSKDSTVRLTCQASVNSADRAWKLGHQSLISLLCNCQEPAQHEHFVAYTLCSLKVGGPDPAIWLNSDDPVLRAVLARTCPSADDNHLRPELIRLLEDPDGMNRPGFSGGSVLPGCPR